jgi:hypothetical protein
MGVSDFGTGLRRTGHRERRGNGFSPFPTALCHNWGPMIGEELVERACSEVAQFTDEQMVHEFDRFFQAQPALCEFIIELTQESGQRIQELSLFLSYIVFKTIELARSGSLPVVSADEIENAYNETESWMERVGKAENDELQLAIVTGLRQEPEPFLLQYIISELNEPMEDGVELNEEEKGHAFFVLKTVITSFNTEPKRRIIELN